MFLAHHEGLRPLIRAITVAIWQESHLLFRQYVLYIFEQAHGSIVILSTFALAPRPPPSVLMPHPALQHTKHTSSQEKKFSYLLVVIKDDGQRGEVDRREKTQGESLISVSSALITL